MVSSKNLFLLHIFPVCSGVLRLLYGPFPLSIQPSSIKNAGNVHRQRFFNKLVSFLGSNTKQTVNLPYMSNAPNMPNIPKVQNAEITGTGLAVP